MTHDPHLTRIFLKRSTKADSVMLIQAHTQIDLSLVAISLTRFETSPSVLDSLHLDFLSFARAFGRSESLLSTVCTSHPALFSVLDLCNAGSFLVVRAFTCLALAPSLVGRSRSGESLFARDFCQFGSFSSPQSLAQPDLSPPALTMSQSDLLLFSQSCTCIGLGLSMLCCSRADLPASLSDMIYSGVPFLAKSLVRPDSKLSAFDMAYSDFALPPRKSLKLGSSLLLFGLLRPGMLLSATDLGEFGSTLPLRSLCHLDFLALLLDLAGTGPVLSLRAFVKLGVPSSILDNHQTGTLILLRSFL